MASRPHLRPRKTGVLRDDQPAGLHFRAMFQRPLALSLTGRRVRTASGDEEDTAVRTAQFDWVGTS